MLSLTLFSLKSLPVSARLLKASLLAFAAIGVAFPRVTSAQPSLSALSSSEPSLSTNSVVLESVAQAPTTLQPAQTVMPDGTYLFGQSETPNEPGSDYIVFSVTNNQAIGAFYQPNSSFDCFSGEVSPSRFAVNITESYTQESYAYAIAMTLDDTLTAGGGAGAYTLKGFHQLERLSDQDQNILAVCQADLAS
jgi:hypothetical protein